MTGGYLLLILFVSILPMPSWCGPKHLWPLTKDTILWDREDDKSVSTFVYGSTCPLLVSDSLYDGEDDGSFYYDGSTTSVADFGVLNDKTDEEKDKYGFTLWLKPDSATSTGELFEYQSTSDDEDNQVTRARAELVNGKVIFTVSNSNGDMWSVTSSVGLDDTKFNSVLLWAKEEHGTMLLHVAVNDQADYSDTTERKEDMRLRLGGKWRLGEFVTSSGARYVGKINCISFYEDDLKPDELDKYMEECGKDMDRHPGVNACRTPEIRTERFKLLARNKAPDVTSLPPMTSFQTSSMVKCAGRCLRTPHCKSFTFSSDDVTSSCSLFDVVTVTGLVDSEGNYYGITSD